MNIRTDTLPRSPRRGLTLAGYIKRRNGVPAGSRGGLRNMLLRSFGASSFEAFWRYWNPIFGYFLGRYVYSPLRRVLPAALALVITFLVCGALHDLVTMAVRGSWAFLFTPWFLFLSVGVLVSRATHMNISRLAWPVRATTHVAYLAVGLALAVVLKNALAL